MNQEPSKNSELCSRAGVYRSDVPGHLLILKLSPVRVTCVMCLETCDMSQFKNAKGRATAAQAFVAKHGALDEKIASSIEEIVPQAESRCACGRKMSEHTEAFCNECGYAHIQCNEQHR